MSKHRIQEVCEINGRGDKSLNLRPFGFKPDMLPDCVTPHWVKEYNKS